SDVVRREVTADEVGEILLVLRLKKVGAQPWKVDDQMPPPIWPDDDAWLKLILQPRVALTDISGDGHELDPADRCQSGLDVLDRWLIREQITDVQARRAHVVVEKEDRCNAEVRAVLDHLLLAGVDGDDLQLESRLVLDVRIELRVEQRRAS